MKAGVGLLVIAALAAGGCSRAGISGAGMMRVEVEVYKGPVGQSPEIQIGELSALLAETVKAVNGWRQSALLASQDGPVSKRTATPLACDSRAGDPDCTALLQALAAAAETGAAICAMDDDIGGYRINSYYRTSADRVEIRDVCTAFALNPAVSPLRTLGDTRVGAQPTLLQISASVPEYTRSVSAIAAAMRIRAFRLVGANAGYVPKSRQVRHLTASLGYLLTEFANSIASRTTVLQRTYPKCVTNGDCETALPAKLATGDYLRDVETTRFLDVYRWMNADVPQGVAGAYKRDDRIAAVKSLTDDYYWEKVNEVYASGQGDASMAFIKDELGNWNLKSYTNDPSKLLAAYRQGANALIASAVDLARKASGDPTAIAKGSRLLDLADRFATGKSTGSPNIGGLDVSALHQRTADRLAALKSRFAGRKEMLTTNRAAAQARVDAAAAVATPDPVLLRREQDALTVIVAQLDQLGSVAAEEAARVLEEHQRDLNTVQASIVGAGAAPATASPK